MAQKLESLSQTLSGHDVVVTGSVRTGSRLAVQAPASVLSERLPAAETDRFNPHGDNPGGLRAGRSVGVSGSPLHHRLPGYTGGAIPSAALKPPTFAQRGVPVIPVSWCLGRMCPTPVTTGRTGTRTRPVT